LNTFHSQKVKPCSITTQFTVRPRKGAGHCSRGGFFRVLRSISDSTKVAKDLFREKMTQGAKYPLTSYVRCWFQAWQCSPAKNCVVLPQGFKTVAFFWLWKVFKKTSETSTGQSSLGCVYRLALLLGACLMFPKNCWWANQYGSFIQKKSCECTHDLTA
jgi:hypothetical protein